MDSKDQLIRDLKSKLSTLEEKDALLERERSATTTGQVLPGPSDVNTLTAAELRGRLKGSELDRARMKTRLQALKERVVELEVVQSTLGEENDRLRKTQDKSDALKATIARKDEIIRSIKTQLERVQQELDDLHRKEVHQQAEHDKKLRHLQRQVEVAQRGQEEMEREMELMRKRMTTGHVDSGPIVNRIQTNIQPQVGREVSMNRSQRNLSSSTISIVDEINIPSSLGIDAVNDIKEVMNLMGVDRNDLSAALSLSPSSDKVDSDSSDEDNEDGRSVGTSSVERRLQALVNAALQTPRRKK